MEVLKTIIFNHMLPAVMGSVLSLLLVLLVLAIFFIRRPGVRYTFLLIPLIKPILLLIGGIKRNGYFVSSGRWFSLQIPDPLNLVPASLDSRFNHSHFNYLELPTKTDLYVILIIAAIGTILAFIIARWLILVKFRADIARREVSGGNNYIMILDIINSLSSKVRICVPKLVIANVPSPFTIGILNPSIVLPSDSIETLTADELEAIIAHEIAHIKRRDNLLLWLSLISRDLMFFNPIAWISFRLLAAEREKAADQLAARITGKPLELASSLAKIAESMVAKGGLAKPSWSMARTNLVPCSNLKARVKSLLNFKPRKRLILRMIPIGLLFLALAYTRLFFYLHLIGVNFYFYG